MIGALLETILLFINAVAILNEKRFLKKCNTNDMKMDSTQHLQLIHLQIKLSLLNLKSL
jgi:hypothetical protein